MSMGKIPRSQTINEGMKKATSPPPSSSTLSNIDAAATPSPSSSKTSKSMLWGWLGFGSGGTSERPSTATASTASNTSSRSSKTLASSGTGASGGSAYLRRWASLVSEGPPGTEEIGRPNTSEPPITESLGDNDKKSKRGNDAIPKGAITYEVSDGDTLQSIAVKLNVTVGEITKLNRFTTRILFPGQMINVPDPNYVHEPPPLSSESALIAPTETNEKSTLASGEQMINEDYECVEKFVKARALYLPNRSLEDAVPGTLLVTPNAVMFDPNAVAALVEQQSREPLPRSSETDSDRASSPQPTLNSKGTSVLPPGDLLLPMSWIASVTIFRQLPGLSISRQRISSFPAPNPSLKTASVASIGEENEHESDRLSTGDTNTNLSSSPKAENAFEEPKAKQDASIMETASAAAGAVTGAVSAGANMAVAAVSESANAITEMSSQLAGAIGTPLKKISLGTLARVESVSQSVETLSLQTPSTDVHLSDPAAPTSLYLRIFGTSSLNDESLAALGIGSTGCLASSSQPSFPEYWFRVPTKCAKGLQLFFTHWNSDMAGTALANPTVSPGSSLSQHRVIGFRPSDNIHRASDGIVESSYKEWEVISIDESIKRNQAEDAEIRRSLPLPEMQGKSTILTDDYVRELCAILPPICIGATWSLLYSSANDGFSLSSVFRAALNLDSPQLLVVHDLSGAVFGAVTSCRLRVSDHFYGSSECCLFSFFPTFRVFRWSGENTFFIKGNRESLSFGSASGIAGLWLDSDLYRGRTQPCATYNNDLLTSTEDFTIEVVELWGFLS